MIPFAEYCGRIQEHLEHFYGIRVVTRDIPDPLTGDLDGRRFTSIARYVRNSACSCWRTCLATRSSGT
jgi:hypothetical protein